MGAQTAAIDCILGRDPQVVVPHASLPLASVLAWADVAPEPSRMMCVVPLGWPGGGRLTRQGPGRPDFVGRCWSGYIKGAVASRSGG